jgi:putative copper export protein
VDEGDWTLLSLWIHIPIVTAWIGAVMWDTFAAYAGGLTDRQRGRMITWTRGLTVAAIVVIMGTGIWQTMRNPFGEVNSYSELSALRENTTYGKALFIKHIFVLATFALTLIVRFYFAPRLLNPADARVTDIPATVPTGGGASAVAPAAQALAATRWLSLLNLAACLGALIFATRMIWELH